MCLRRSEFVTRGPSKLAKQPSNQVIVKPHYKSQRKSHDSSMTLIWHDTYNINNATEVRIMFEYL
jgi:hypothetical protein